MPVPLVAGNWKMHGTVEEARHRVWEMLQPLQEIQGVDKVLCPPFTALLAVANMLMGTDIGLGAQNMHWEPQGAYTGEISPPMVAEFAQYVILGHSERRRYFGETDEAVARKVRAALDYRLHPIVCIGETLEERQQGRTDEVVRHQLLTALQHCRPEELSRVIIAYEPVWAIGTGLTPEPEEANRIHRDVIRQALAHTFGEPAAREVRVLYGGSVKPQNALPFFQQPHIDGALVGGASLDPQAFVTIVRLAAQAKAAPAETPANAS